MLESEQAPPPKQHSDAKWPVVSPPDENARLESSLMGAFDGLENKDPGERMSAIRTMLLAASSAKAKPSSPRTLAKRVRAVEKALVDALFDDEHSVRWAAAYAIASLEDKKGQLIATSALYVADPTPPVQVELAGVRHSDNRQFCCDYYDA